MSSFPKFSRSPVFLVVAYLILTSIACGIPLLPTSTPTPTATLPAEVDSALRTKLLGQWQVVSGGAWEGAILTFNQDGSFTISGGSQKKKMIEAVSFFTAENTIAFSFPDYQGSAEIQLINSGTMNLDVTTSDQVFGMIYSVERVK